MPLGSLWDAFGLIVYALDASGMPSGSHFETFAPSGRFFDILGRLLDASGTHLGSFWTPWTPLGCLRDPILNCKTRIWMNVALYSSLVSPAQDLQGVWKVLSIAIQSYIYLYMDEYSHI